MGLVLLAPIALLRVTPMGSNVRDLDVMRFGFSGPPRYVELMQIDASPTDSRLAVKIYPGDADPTLTMVSPANGAVIATGRRITMGGRAFDDHGVSAVQVVLRRSDGVGLQADGRLGVAAWLPGFVTNPGGPATNWQFSSPVLTAGVWTVYSRAIDSVGKEQLTYLTATVTLR